MLATACKYEDNGQQSEYFDCSHRLQSSAHAAPKLGPVTHCPTRFSRAPITMQTLKHFKDDDREVLLSYVLPRDGLCAL